MADSADRLEELEFAIAYELEQIAIELAQIKVLTEMESDVIDSE